LSGIEYGASEGAHWRFFGHCATAAKQGCARSKNVQRPGEGPHEDSRKEAPVIHLPEDREICKALLRSAWDRGDRAKSLPDLITETGSQFLGAPYEPDTLEGEGPEELVVNLRTFDCVTFVENAVVLAGLISPGEDPLPPRTLRWLPIPPPLLHRLAFRQWAQGPRPGHHPRNRRGPLPEGVPFSHRPPRGPPRTQRSRGLPPAAADRGDLLTAHPFLYPEGRFRQERKTDCRRRHHRDYDG
jgi:hypothetical protein